MWLSPSTLLCFPSSTSPPGMKGAVYTTSGGPTQGRAGAFVLNYSDKKALYPGQPHYPTQVMRTDGGTKRHMVCPLAPLTEGSRLEETESPQCLPYKPPLRSLVSLYHTLLITAMTGPLSQRMPSSFSGATCSQGAASRLSVLGR